MTSQKESSDTEYQIYLDHRKVLNNMELEVSGRYDQWIITLAGGALIFSITFLEKIATQPKPLTLWFLGASWIFLLLTLIFGLFSLLTSQSAIRRERDILDENLGEENPTPESQKNIFATCTHLLNVLSIITFALGIMLLCLFSILNSSKKGLTYEQRQSEYNNQWLCTFCNTQDKATASTEKNTKPTKKIKTEIIKGREKMEIEKDTNKQSIGPDKRDGVVPPSSPRPQPKPRPKSPPSEKK